MTRNGYMTLLGSVAAIVIASLASIGLAMLPAIGQPGPGQLIVTTLTGTENLSNVQPATGPQFVAISATNLAAFVNTGGTGGGSFANALRFGRRSLLSTGQRWRRYFPNRNRNRYGQSGDRRNDQ